MATARRISTVLSRPSVFVRNVELVTIIRTGAWVFCKSSQFERGTGVDETF